VCISWQTCPPTRCALFWPLLSLQVQYVSSVLQVGAEWGVAEAFCCGWWPRGCGCACLQTLSHHYLCFEQRILPAPCAEADTLCLRSVSPGTGILKLSAMDENCQQLTTIQECTQKVQLTVSSGCMIQLQPDLPVAVDGSFCSPSKGVQQRGEQLKTRLSKPPAH
jgi:hypothetical protein